MTVNVERNQMWADALRSGEYTQAKYNLRLPLAGGQGYGYCCLGVATQVAVQNGLELGAEEAYLDGAYPRDEVVQWYGWGNRNPHVGALVHNCDGEDCDGSVGPISAVTANDTEGWTFAQIADGVEQFIIGKGATDGAE